MHQLFSHTGVQSSNAVPPCRISELAGLQFPSNNKLLGKSFQKALRAFWDEARKGFGVHWCVYTNGHRSPCGLRDARKGIGVQQVLVLNTAKHD